MKIGKLLIAATSLVLAHTASAQEGAWKGELDVMGTKLPLVFHFSDQGCTLDSPMQGAKGLAAEWKRESSGNVDVRVPMIGASFQGIYDGLMIKGNFKQNGMTLPLTLISGDHKLNRPQTPVGPVKYTTEDISFYNGKVQLRGTLTLPRHYSQKTPILVMLTGSGLQNRDEEVFDHRPFAVLADALARNGIATLRYDDRGYNDTTFPAEQLTAEHFEDDARIAIREMRKRFKKVGVLGHSAGGTLAMMIASKGEADFVVSLAGMAISGRQQLLLQNRKAFLLAGMPESQVNRYCNALDKGMEMLIDGFTANEVRMPENVYVALTQNFIEAIKQLDTPYMRSLIRLDASLILSHVKCPVLAVNGKLDTQVDCELNLRTIEQLLPTNKKNKVIAYDELNHLFQHCTTGEPTEYIRIEETISPDVIAEVTQWMKQFR